MRKVGQALVIRLLALRLNNHVSDAGYEIASTTRRSCMIWWQDISHATIKTRSNSHFSPIRSDITKWCYFSLQRKSIVELTNDTSEYICSKIMHQEISSGWNDFLPTILICLPSIRRVVVWNQDIPMRRNGVNNIVNKEIRSYFMSRTLNVRGNLSKMCIDMPCCIILIQRC